MTTDHKLGLGYLVFAALVVVPFVYGPPWRWIRPSRWRAVLMEPIQGDDGQR